MTHRPAWLVGATYHLRDLSRMRKWVVLGAIVGLVAGLGAAAFFWALDLAAGFFLGTLVGFSPPGPPGDGTDPFAIAERWWLLPAVVGLGGLFAGLIVYRFAPETAGAGQDAAIDALHHRARSIRARVPVVKLAASAITIGSGGSGGREGPTAQIGAGLGSILSRGFDLDARDARILVASGMGAGIGAIFRAPLGGAVLAAEIPYQDDVESEALVPGFVASIVAFAVFGSIIGFEPIFGQLEATFADPVQLVYYAVIGIAAGLLGRFYIHAFYRTKDLFTAWSVPRYLKPAVAGVAVGFLGLLLPGVLGTGYGWIETMLSRETLMAIPIGVVLLLPFAKILATSLSIGSGGSGGVFGPGMFVGGLLGAALWRVLEPIAPHVPAEPAAFVIVAMVALFGSIAHAPLAVMLMVAEMTGNLAMLAPAMLAVGLATLVVGDRTMFKAQLRSRADSPVHRYRMAMPLMASIPAREVVRPAPLILADDTLVVDARQQMDAAGLTSAPVITADGQLWGSLDRGVLEAATTERIADLVGTEMTLISADDPLDDALGVLVDEGREAGLVEEDGRLLGSLSTRDIMDAYRIALAGNVRRMGPAGQSGETVVEVDIQPGSMLAGKTIAEAGLPGDTVVLSIERDERVSVPTIDMTLRVNDRLSLLTSSAHRDALLRRLAGKAP